MSQTETDMIITDQQAVHERLTYEKMKRQLNDRGVVKQSPLIPEIVEVTEPQREALLELRTCLLH